MHTLKINDDEFKGYTLNDCIRSIQAAWEWGYFLTASIDGVAVTETQLLNWGCV